jgi:isopenicillin-N epimerase
MEKNHTLALGARSALCEALGAGSPCPETMVGAMASVPLPALAPGCVAGRLGHEEMTSWIRARGVEAWFGPWPSPGGKVVRVSAQLYNIESQFARLVDLLEEAMHAG